MDIKVTRAFSVPKAWTLTTCRPPARQITEAPGRQFFIDPNERGRILTPHANRGPQPHSTRLTEIEKHTHGFYPRAPRRTEPPGWRTRLSLAWHRACFAVAARFGRSLPSLGPPSWAAPLFAGSIRCCPGRQFIKLSVGAAENRDLGDGGREQGGSVGRPRLQADCWPPTIKVYGMWRQARPARSRRSPPGFIAPCIPTLAKVSSWGPAMAPRDQARRIPHHCPQGSRARAAAEL